MHSKCCRFLLGWVKVCEGGSKAVLAGSGEAGAWPARGAALVSWYFQVWDAPAL